MLAERLAHHPVRRSLSASLLWNLDVAEYSKRLQLRCSTVRPAYSGELCAHPSHDTCGFRKEEGCGADRSQKIFVKTFPQCGFLTKGPNMRREIGALNACASIVSQREEKVIRARRSVSKNRNYFAETNKIILYHRDRNFMALDAHRQWFLLDSWDEFDEILVLAWKFCLNTKKKEYRNLSSFFLTLKRHAGAIRGWDKELASNLNIAASMSGLVGLWPPYFRGWSSIIQPWCVS